MALVPARYSPTVIDKKATRLVSTFGWVVRHIRCIMGHMSVEQGFRGPAGLQFRLLGPLEVLHDGIGVELGPPKQRAILAALLLAEGRVVSADRLIESVWGDSPPLRALASVQVYVSKLRALLPSNDSVGIARKSPGYALTAEWVDVVEFRRLSARAGECVRGRFWPEAVDVASAAIALWRGPFLDDLADEPWVNAEATQLDEMYAQCLGAWVTGLLGRGNLGEAVTRSQILVQAYPLREHCWWLRMMALHRAGRSPEALDAYRHFSGELDEQLGLEPGPELRDLHLAILRQDGALSSWPNRTDTEPPTVEPDFIDPVERERPPSTAPPPEGPARAGTAEIVGRAEQLAALDSFTEDVVAGHYRWVLLTGRAGMGKTRLATEAADRARRRGVQTVWTSCPDDPGMPAWWPLRTLVSALGGNPDAVFLPPAGVDADTVRFNVYERFSALLWESSTTGPLLVVIDDAQWLDAASMRCLGFFARTQHLAHVGIILTVRDRELRPEFDQVLATISREDFTVHLPVEPLDGPSASQLLRQVAGDTVSAADVFALMRRIGGNPLLLIEYARLPVVDRRSGHIPLAARGLLERRLRRLPEEVLVVLRTAGVIGETFELDLLAAVTGLDLLAVVDRLDAAAADGIIDPATSGAGYQFRHGLLRDAVIAQLTVLRRQALHARIAEQLVGAGQSWHTLIRRAHHLSAAMPIVGPNAVVEGATAAARAAEIVWDWDAAAQQWESALAALQVVVSTDPTVRDDLLIARLAALARAGRAQTVLDTVEATLDMARASGQTTTIGRMAGVLLRTSGAWPWPAYGADPSALLARLDGLAPSVADDPAALARVLAALAVGNCYHPDLSVPDMQSQRALEIAERLGDPDVLADALLGRVLTYIGVAGHAEEASTLLARLDALPHSFQVLDAVQRHNLLTMVEFSRGAMDAAAWHLREGVLGSDRLRLPVTRVQLRWVEAMLAEWHGDLDRAQELVDKAYELHRQTELYSAEVTHQTATLAGLWNRGRLSGSPLINGTGEPLVWGALAAAETGDVDRGADLLGRRMAIREPDYWYTLAYRTWMAHAAADLGLKEVAPRLLELLAPNRTAVASVGQSVSVGPVSLATGKLRAVLGDVDGAHADLAIAERQARTGRGAAAMVRIRLAQLSLDPPSAQRSAALSEVAGQAERTGMQAVAAAAQRAVLS